MVQVSQLTQVRGGVGVHGRIVTDPLLIMHVRLESPLLLLRQLGLHLQIQLESVARMHLLLQ